MDGRQLSQRLSEQAESVVAMLLPNGKRQGSQVLVGDTSGKTGKSMSVCVKGSRAGLWADFAGNEGGDLIELWKETKGITYAETFEQVRKYLGVEPDNKFYGEHQKNYVRPEKPKCCAPKDLPLQYLESRGFTVETIKAFEIGVDKNNVYFPFKRDGELVMCKWRSIRDKKTAPTCSDQEPILFGWQALSDTRTVAITEGEFDAMALHQFGIPALSVPFGGGGGNKQRWIENEYKNLERFDTIYVAMDNDDPGREAAYEIIQRLGRHRCKMVCLPEKDANDCLKAGYTSEYIKRYFENAVSIDPEELKQASAYEDELINEFYPERLPERPGFYGPWPHTHNQFRFSMSELSIFVGINGHGKSQMVGHLTLEAMRAGQKVCIASMELKPGKLLKRLTSQVAGLRDGRPPDDYIRAISNWYHDKLFLFSVVGETSQDKIFEVFEYSFKRYGTRIFVIDSMMMCGIDEEDNQGQKRFIQKCVDFKNEFDVHLMLVTHPRKGADEYKMMGKFDVKGSGAVTDLADMVFIVWRNKKKEEMLEEAEEDVEEIEGKPDAILKCCKNRNGEWEGKVNLWFARNCFQYLSGPDQKPFQYIQYMNHQVVGL